MSEKERTEVLINSSANRATLCAVLAQREQQLAELRALAKAHDLNDYKTYIKWRGIEAGWDRELTPTELGDIIAAAALKEG